MGRYGTSMEHPMNCQWGVMEHPWNVQQEHVNGTYQHLAYTIHIHHVSQFYSRGPALPEQTYISTRYSRGPALPDQATSTIYSRGPALPDQSNISIVTTCIFKSVKFTGQVMHLYHDRTN